MKSVNNECPLCGKMYIINYRTEKELEKYDVCPACRKNLEELEGGKE